MKKIVKILLIIIIPYTIFGQTPCLDAVANATGLIGEFIPQCQEDGSYAPIQCWSSTGYCWCVDENGVEIPGTSLGPGEGIPNCECSDFSADISVMDVSSSGQYSCELIINVTAGDPPYFCSLGTEFLTLGDLPSEFTIPNLGGGLYNLTIGDSNNCQLFIDVECAGIPSIDDKEKLVNRHLLKRIDALGRVTNTKKGLQLYIYNDGSIEKIYLQY